MARAKLHHLVVDADGDVQPSVSVAIYQPGTTTPITVYANPSGGSPISNPVTSNGSGYVECYTDTPQRADVVYSGATIHSQFDPDPGVVVTTDRTQTITGNKTFSGSNTFSGASTFSGVATFSVPPLLPDGSVGAPGAAFSGDPTSGVYKFAAGGLGWAAGGVDAMRMVKDTYGTRVSFGNPAVPITPSDGSGTVVTVNHTTSANNNGTIGLVSSVINNGAVGSDGLTGFPDFAAVSLSTFQTDVLAKGSMRPIEAHSIRIKASASASTQMIAELGGHTALAGNSNFPFSSIDAYSRGIWLASYQDDNMIGFPGGPYAAQSFDVGLLITGHPGGGGAGGFRYPIVTLDSSNVLRYALKEDGTLYLSTGGNAGAPQVTFIGDTDTGVFQGGANVLGFAAGGTEHARCTSLAFQVSTGLIWNGVISPAQLTANTNDWNPTGLATATGIRVSTDAPRDLTGISALSRRVLALHQIGASSLTLKNNTTSSAANRFFTPGGVDYVLGANESVLLWYDDTTSCWRIFGTN